VQQAKGQFVAEGKFFGPGSYVVPMAQPKMGLVRWMLGRTFYGRRQQPEPAEHRRRDPPDASPEPGCRATTTCSSHRWDYQRILQP
jgi:hypothetical protein